MADLKTIMDGVWLAGAVCGAISVLTGGYLVYRNAKKDSTIPEGMPVCNLSEENNEWNKLALATLQKKREERLRQSIEADYSQPRGLQINLSPFNNQWNSLCLEYSKMQREGATKDELEAYVESHPITTDQGQMKLPRRYI